MQDRSLLRQRDKSVTIIIKLIPGRAFGRDKRHQGKAMTFKTAAKNPAFVRAL